jgi:hypothetical protein
LDARHTFSFAGYYDPAYMGFRALRVINEDRIEPGAGFAMHSHRDMEIVTYIIEGALEHKDSLGSVGVIRRNEAQRMTAGTGITHSEYNASGEEPVHLLQIWILPDKPGHAPGYEQLLLDKREHGQWQHVASGSGVKGALSVRQDVELLRASLNPGQHAGYGLRPGRHAWAQMVRGRAALNGLSMMAGDGAAISGETEIDIVAGEFSELLLFDLA